MPLQDANPTPSFGGLGLKRGSFTVITGRIGAGKTTLLEVLLGLLPMDAGEVRWNGEPVADTRTFLSTAALRLHPPDPVALQRHGAQQYPDGPVCRRR